MEHYSARFGRNYQDDDLLFFNEALAVISQNSDWAEVPTRHLSDLVDQGKLHGEVLIPRKVRLYRYAEVKSLTYKKGPGRLKHDNPSPGALRKRRHDERLKKVG